MKRLFSKLNKKKNFDPLGILNNPSPKTADATDNVIISGRSTLTFADRKISKRNMIIVVAAFALVGSYIIYRSFAATDTVNDSAVGTSVNQFEFVGSWTNGQDSSAFGGDEHYSNSVGAYYQVRFSGSQIKVYTTADPNHGIAAVSIDGGAETMVDTYAATRSHGVLVYTSPALTEGSHTLKVRVTGNKNVAAASAYIVADKVEIISNTSTTPPPTSGCVVANPSTTRIKASGRDLVDENGAKICKMKGFNMHVGPGFTWPQSNFDEIKNLIKTADPNSNLINRAAIHWDQFEPSQGVINGPSNPMDANAATNSFIYALDNHVARAQAAGMYTMFELHLNLYGDDRIPDWTNNVPYQMDKYTTYGKTLTQYLAQRYGNPNSPKYTKAVLGFGLNEPPLEDTYVRTNDPIPYLEGKQRTMISWMRASGYAPNWIGFVAEGYASATTLYNTWGTTNNTTAHDASPTAYDSVGGNVIYDFHDYMAGCNNTDATCDARQTNGTISAGYSGSSFVGVGNNFSLNSTNSSQISSFVKPYKEFLTQANIPLMVGEWGWPNSGSGEVDWLKESKKTWNDAGTAIEIYWNYDTSSSKTEWSAKIDGTNWRPSILEWVKPTTPTDTTPTPDTISPTVAWAKPAEGATISGYLFDAATSGTSGPCEIFPSDNVEVTKVLFYVDGQLLNQETTSPWNCKFDTTTVSNGNHTLKAEAYDAAGNVGSATRVVNVQNSTSSTGWNLVYEDNFDGTSVNTTLTDLSQKKSAWSLYDGSGHAGNGLRRPEALSVANGILTLTAKNVDSDGNGTLDKVQSGGMSNKTNMTYGKYEARVRTDVDPSGIMSGVLLTWPESGTNWANGENDYYETGHPVNTRNPFYSYIHYPDTPENTSPTPQKQFVWNSDGAQWHRVVMEWTADYINIKVYKSPDGGPETLVSDQTLRESDDPNRNNIPDVLHHPTVQLDAFSTALLSQPVRMQVDYMRVYKQSSTNTDNPPTVSINAPSPNTTISGASYNTVTAATDDKGIAKVEFYLDGVLKLTQNETAPLPISKTYNYAFDSFQFANNSQHTFMVKVYDGVNAATTNSANFIVNNPDTTKPSAPTALNLALVNNNTDVKLDWSGASDNTGVTGYYVYRHEGDASKAITIATLSNVTTYTDTTPLSGTTYYYYVIAKDAAGNLSTPSPTNSIQVPVVTDTTAPTTPTNLNATAISSNQINLSWTPSTDNIGVKEYRIYRDNNFVGSHQASLCNTTVCTWSEAGLTANTAYGYQVEAVDAAGNLSQPKAGPLSISTKPLAITLKLINADTDQVISGLTDGMTIDLKNARNLNIDASANGIIESVQFNDNGQIVTESFPPYAIGGDAGTGSSDYYPWTPTVGSHTLTAKAYSADGATGTELASTTINFTVVDTTLSEALSVEAESMSIPPDLSAAKILSDTSASGGNLLRFYKNYESSRQVTINGPITTMKIKAKGFQCGGRSPQMMVKIGNTQLPVTVSSTSWAEYTVSTDLTSGTHTLSIAFNNDYSQYSGNSSKMKCSLDLDVDKVTFN